MANSAAKERVKKNAVLMQKYFRVIMACNVRAVRPRRDRAAQTPSCTPAAQGVYIGYRVILLWSTFSNWHMAGFGAMLAAYAALYGFLWSSAMPKYDATGALIYGGADMDGKGVLEYSWDLLFVTMFIQLGTGLVSDWFWLTAIIPPVIGMYYLWVKVIYPWISTPDAEVPQVRRRPHPVKPRIFCPCRPEIRQSDWPQTDARARRAAADGREGDAAARPAPMNARARSLRAGPVSESLGRQPRRIPYRTAPPPHRPNDPEFARKTRREHFFARCRCRCRRSKTRMWRRGTCSRR